MEGSAVHLVHQRHTSSLLGNLGVVRACCRQHGEIRVVPEVPPSVCVSGKVGCRGTRRLDIGREPRQTVAVRPCDACDGDALGKVGGGRNQCHWARSRQRVAPPSRQVSPKGYIGHPVRHARRHLLALQVHLPRREGPLFEVAVVKQNAVFVRHHRVRVQRDVGVQVGAAQPALAPGVRARCIAPDLQCGFELVRRAALACDADGIRQRVDPHVHAHARRQVDVDGGILQVHLLAKRLGERAAVGGGKDSEGDPPKLVKVGVLVQGIDVRQQQPHRVAGVRVHVDTKTPVAQRHGTQHAAAWACPGQRCLRRGWWGRCRWPGIRPTPWIGAAASLPHAPPAVDLRAPGDLLGMELTAQNPAPFGGRVVRRQHRKRSARGRCVAPGGRQLHRCGEV